MQREDNDINVMLKHLIDSQPIEDYEGRSSKEIHYMIYDPFCENSPLSVKKNIDPFVLEQIPIFNLIQFYLLFLDKEGSIKLNKNGELSAKFVKAIHSKNFFNDNDSLVNLKILKGLSEPISISCARIITELSGLAKLRKNVISLTRKGKRILDNFSHNELFHEILTAYTTKFNWSYFDDFGDNDIGQFGFTFTLDLIAKYGKIMHNYQFYSDKYRRAFGFTLFNTEESNMEFIHEFYEQCFTTRTIDRFLKWFGLVIFADGSGVASGERYLLKSKIFDNLISFD